MKGVSEPRSEYLPDDGLLTPEVGVWADYKYQLIAFYNAIFSTGMKEKWDTRVYIDLFAGAGKARIKKTGKIVRASPLIALSVKDKYDKYIFCDERSENIEALQKRVSQSYPDVDVQYIVGDCNKKVNEIVRLIPPFSKTTKVLSFCLVDPFSLRIEFNSIKTLSRYYVDFLILMALAMDAKRNESLYTNPHSKTVEHFLGLANWRDRWKEAMRSDSSFSRFLAREYANQMVGLGYLNKPNKSLIEVRSGEKNLPLYHLAFFSRHEKGYQFWDEVRKYVLQPSLF